MTKKTRSKSISLPIFRHTVTFILTSDITKEYPKWTNEELDKDPAACCAYDDRQGVALIFLNHSASAGVIAHEIYHAITRMDQNLHRRGSFSEETTAYLLTYLLDEALKFIHGK